MTVGSAPGKAILFGEHAVVYGHPAIAVPLGGVRAMAEIRELAGLPQGHVLLEAPDIGLHSWLHEMDEGHPLAQAIMSGLAALGVENAPALEIQLSSTIPPASGLGSSAAITVATLRALGEHFETPLTLELQSELTYGIEVLYHGTPSGVDNTVVVFEKPVWFRPGDPPVPLVIGEPFTLVVADTGESSDTAEVVRGVRKRRDEDPEQYELLFGDIEAVVVEARRAIELGDNRKLGNLMDRNQILLQRLGVSSASLEQLIDAAREAGAQGAKLSGAGQGGNMIALVSPEATQAVLDALERAGAINAFTALIE